MGWLTRKHGSRSQRGAKFLAGRDDQPTIQDALSARASSHAYAMSKLCPRCQEAIRARAEYGGLVTLSDIKRQGEVCQGEQHKQKLVAEGLAVSNVGFQNGLVTVEMNDGTVLSNQIEVVPHEEWVGAWDKGKPVIYIDDDLPDQYRMSIAVHEAVEKFLAEKLKLNAMDIGHDIAENIEKEWFMDTYKEPALWDQYTRLVAKVHRKEEAEAQRSGASSSNVVGGKTRRRLRR